MAVAHYLEALEWQKDVIKIHAILGSKNPHPQTFLVGGMSIPVDPDSQNAINADKIAYIRKLLRKARAFVEQVYIPDLLAVAPAYLDWAGIGGGVGNYLSYGDFPMDNSPGTGSLFFPRGVIMGKDLANVMEMDEKKITEYVTHSWYNYSTGDDKGLHPYEGETSHNYTGPKPPYEFLDTDGKYSWVKSPRYMDQPMEVGPLARILVAYASGVTEVKDTVDFVLEHPRRSGLGALLDPGPHRRPRRRLPAARPEERALARPAGRQHGARHPTRPSTRRSGIRRPGRKRPRASATTKHRAARSATGSASRTRRSPTTRRLSPRPGMPARAMPPGRWDPTSRP